MDEAHPPYFRYCADMTITLSCPYFSFYPELRRGIPSRKTWGFFIFRLTVNHGLCIVYIYSIGGGGH